MTVTVRLVDAADGRHPGAAHRLLVRDHGQRFQGGLSEPSLLAVQDEPLDDCGTRRIRVEAPPTRDLAQLEGR